MKEYNYGNNLKSIRIAAKLTQVELGNKFGLCMTIISYYEKERRHPSFMITKKYLKLAKRCKLNFQLSDLRPAEKIKHARNF